MKAKMGMVLVKANEGENGQRENTQECTTMDGWCVDMSFYFIGFFFYS
jgi:hypothetical protein